MLSIAFYSIFKLTIWKALVGASDRLNAHAYHLSLQDPIKMVIKEQTGISPQGQRHRIQIVFKIPTFPCKVKLSGKTSPRLQAQGVNLDYAKMVISILFPLSGNSFRNGHNTLFWTRGHDRKSAYDRINSGKYPKVLTRVRGRDGLNFCLWNISCCPILPTKGVTQCTLADTDRLFKTWVPDYVLQSLD